MKGTLLVIVVLFFIQAKAQENYNKDSLLKLLPRTPNDSSKVLLMIKIGQQYEGSEPETAKYWYRQSLDLSRNAGYKLGEIKFATNYTYVLNMQGHYDSSLQINLAALDLARKTGNQEYYFKTLFNTGSSYRMLEDYESALRIYLEAYPIVTSFKDDILTGQALDIIQSLYTELKQYRKSIAYGRHAVELLRNKENPVLLSMALSNLGINYANIRQFDSALIFYQEALKLAKLSGDKYIESASYLNIGDTYIKMLDFEKSGTYFENALLLSKELESVTSLVMAHRGLAYFHLSRGDHSQSSKYADTSLILAKQLGSKAELQKTYSLLSNLAMSRQDLKEAEFYSMMATEMSDSILNESIYRHTIELDKKYQTELKDKQIRLQQADIRNKTIVNYALIGGSIILLLLSVLAYRMYKNRQRLQQQLIAELETEKKLAATEAVLKGEEQERTRLAKDLHDGLGGMLSGIKYSLHTMKGNLVMTPENAQAFERSIDMLDSSISEMRRVAHNMMPEVLVKFGLDTALSDFCSEINNSGVLHIMYQSIGFENREVDLTVSVTIYRIVQELVNNIIKHAAARNVLVQVTSDSNKLSITVEDDGRGFNQDLLNSAEGIGWNNIRHRLDFLKAKLDLKTEQGKGTSVHIEI